MLDDPKGQNLRQHLTFPVSSFPFLPGSRISSRFLPKRGQFSSSEPSPQLLMWLHTDALGIQYSFLQRYCSLPHQPPLWLKQFVSSEPSPQSLYLSHTRCWLIHRLLVQRNWSLLHDKQPTSSVPSRQFFKPSHLQLPWTHWPFAQRNWIHGNRISS